MQIDQLVSFHQGQIDIDANKFAGIKPIQVKIWNIIV